MSSSDPSDRVPSPTPRDTRASPEGPQQAKSAFPPGLYIVSTPIGNLRDITLRALDALTACDEVLAEDTRVARRLLDAHGLNARLTAYHDHNGAQRRPELVKRLRDGETIALVSDAGTPLVSDPGYKLVREAADAGVDVHPVPGASALLAGLVTSGLPSDRFLFAGFAPSKRAARRSWLKEIASVPATLVLFESGPRLAALLEDMASEMGGARDAAVARELTKLFEETRRGTLFDLAGHYREAGPPRGEIVVMAGPPLAASASEAEIDAALTSALARLPTKAAAEEVARALGLARREAYQRALHLKDRGDV